MTVYNTGAPAGDCCGLWPHGPLRIAHKPGDLTKRPLPPSSHPFVHPERCPSFRLAPRRFSLLRRPAPVKERPIFVALPEGGLGTRCATRFKASRPVAAGSTFARSGRLIHFAERPAHHPTFDDFRSTPAKQRRADAPPVVPFLLGFGGNGVGTLQSRTLPVRTLIALSQRLPPS